MSKILKVARHRMGCDGKGVSTLVAFWGCPLNCKYCLNNFCHNPEVPTREIKPEDLVKELLIDDIYFRMTGGGIVFGGGEPLLNSHYIESVIKLTPVEWQYRIETSLNVSWEHVERLLTYIDQWFIDIKDLNANIYNQYTGKDNSLVISNCHKLSEAVGKDKIIFRIPRIPNYNKMDDVEASVAYFSKLGHTECFDYIIKT